MKKNKSLNFIDLFSGCGGFSTGMELAGHKCLLGIDFDKSAIDSFKLNHKDAHALHLDIHKLSKEKLEILLQKNKVDLVIGGPPCQGFSTVGKGDSDDIRNSLFRQFVRVVSIVKPRFILFENVVGILASKNRKTLKTIFSSFEKLGYNMDARVLSSDEYGVASIRRRTIIMGVKNGLPSFPETSLSRGEKIATVEGALKPLLKSKKSFKNHDREKALIKNELDQKRVKYIPMGRGIRYEKDELALLPKKLRYGVDWKTLRERRFRQTRLQRLHLKAPAPTILTSRSMYIHPTEDRYLTSKEASLLQSFPLSFEFCGSETSIFRQIGNAVPPLLAKALGEELLKIKELKSVQVKKLPKKNNFEIMKRAFEYKKNSFI